MIVYLIRHAHALDGDDDAARPLSAKGRKQIRRMAALLKRAGLIETREFWHSPLVRARDTAALLAGEIRIKAKLVEVANIEPFAPPQKMAARLRKVRQSVVVVGHEPHLSALATLLLGGDAAQPRVVMKKCAVLALERTGRNWAVRWLISPETIPDS
jgi:phosphohistidine phosphatase